MKTRVYLTSSIALLLGLASIANAQLKAGSPEEKEFTKIEAEKNADTKLAMLLEFEKQYASVNPKVMATICLMAMDIYSEKDNKPKIAEYGDKAIAKDPGNVSALLRVSLNYSKERTDLPKAVEYAEKAKELLVAMRTQPAPTGRTEAEWKQWLDANAASAEQYASYARSLQR
jgi:hypothetical protein